MRVWTFSPWQTLPPAAVRARTVVVFDVLRATTTVAAALAAGAPAVHPVAGVDAARALAARLPGALLGGEVDLRPPADFDLGNSPTEYTRERLHGRPVVLATTNGTRALEQAADAEALFVAALVNARATAEALPQGPDVVLVPSGTVGRPSLEDLLGAGALLHHLASTGQALRLDVTADTALQTFRAVADRLAETLRRTENGARLAAAGFAADVAFAARIDALPIVARVVARHPLTVTGSPWAAPR